MASAFRPHTKPFNVMLVLCAILAGAMPALALDPPQGPYENRAGVNFYGGGGNDTLATNNGSDFLHGGTEDDLLYGKSGYDIFTGGEGADRFVFDAFHNARSEILDFGRDDTLQIAPNLLDEAPQGAQQDWTKVGPTDTLPRNAAQDRLRILSMAKNVNGGVEITFPNGSTLFLAGLDVESFQDANIEVVPNDLHKNYPPE